MKMIGKGTMDNLDGATLYEGRNTRRLVGLSCTDYGLVNDLGKKLRKLSH